MYIYMYIYISLYFFIYIFGFVVKCQIQRELRTRESVFFFVSPVSTTVATFPLLRKSNAFCFWCWMTETDVGVNSRALSHLFCSFHIQNSMELSESAEGGEGGNKKRRESERESVCNSERERERKTGRA